MWHGLSLATLQLGRTRYFTSLDSLACHGMQTVATLSRMLEAPRVAAEVLQLKSKRKEVPLSQVLL